MGNSKKNELSLVGMEKAESTDIVKQVEKNTEGGIVSEDKLYGF